MTIQVRSEENNLQSLLESLYSNTNTQDDLGRLRSKAWEHFLGLGLPKRRDEVFRYVPLKKLFAQNFAVAEEVVLQAEQISEHILPECVDSVIVFVNGYFQPSLSRLQGIPSKVSLLPIEDAVRTYSGFFMNNWAKSLKDEADPFVTLNAALHPRGAFLYIPPKTVVEKPIQVLNIVTAETPVLLMPRLTIFAGAQSDVQLASTYTALTKASYFYNGVIEAILEDDVHVKCYQYVNQVVEDAWHFNAYRGNIKRNSVLKTVDVTDGSQTVRTDYRCVLVGENSEALLSNLWMLSGNREAHTHVLMDHQAPNCHSMQLFKGALSDFSRSSFEGKILVRQAAQKTDAFQLNNNLLLSERTHADSKPNLEIFADDVKASHGATFGQLNDEHLFYMKSRGFTDADAKSLLVYGYCKEILEMIPISSLYEQIKERAQRFLTKE